MLTFVAGASCETGGGTVAAEVVPPLLTPSLVIARRTHALLTQSRLAHRDDVTETSLSRKQCEVDVDVINTQVRDATDEAGNKHGGWEGML